MKNQKPQIIKRRSANSAAIKHKSTSQHSKLSHLTSLDRQAQSVSIPGYDDDFEEDEIAKEAYWDDFEEVSHQEQAKNKSETIDLPRLPADLIKKARILSRYLTFEQTFIPLFDIIPNASNFHQFVTENTQRPDLDDYAEKGVQTDDLKLRNVWTMCPSGYSDAALGFGIEGQKQVSRLLSSQHLNRFVSSAATLFEKLLDYGEYQDFNTLSDVYYSVPGFSDHFHSIDFSSENLLHDRRINSLQIQNEMILIGFGYCKEYKNTFSILGVVGVWTHPFKSARTILLTESEPTALSGCNNHVFAGCSDGTVAVWKLGETHTRHVYSCTISPLLSPLIHRSKITNIYCFERGKDFELISVDVTGAVSFWRVSSPPRDAKDIEITLLHHFNSVHDHEWLVGFAPLGDDSYLLAKNTSLVPVQRFGQKVSPFNYNLPKSTSIIRSIETVRDEELFHVALHGGTVCSYKKNSPNIIRIINLYTNMLAFAMSNSKEDGILYSDARLFLFNLAKHAVDEIHAWDKQGQRSSKSKTIIQSLRFMPRWENKAVTWLKDDVADRVEIHSLQSQ